MSLVSPEDLREFAGLETNVVMQRQTIAFHGGLPLLTWHLEQMFGGVILESGKDGKKPMLKVFPSFHHENSRQVMDAVVIVFESQHILSINWIGNPMNDTIADAVLAIILAAESSPASLKGIIYLTPKLTNSGGSDITSCSASTQRSIRSCASFPRSAIRRCSNPSRRRRGNPRGRY